MNFIEKQKKAESFIDEKQIMNLKQDKKKFYELIKRIMKDKVCTEEEAYDYIRKRIQSVAIQQNKDKGGQISRSDTFLIKTLETIKQRNLTFTDLLNKYKKNTDKKIIHKFDADMEKNIEKITLKFINELDDETRREILENKNMSPKEKNFVNEFWMKAFNEYYQILKKSNDQNYNTTLSKTIELLDEFGTLRENTYLQNARMELLGLDFMKIKYDKESKKDKDVTVKEILSPKAIEKMPDAIKKVLLAFYSNRLVKVAEDMYESMFIGKRIGGLENINNVPDERLKKLVVENQYLNKKMRIMVKNERNRLENTPRNFQDDKQIVAIEDSRKLIKRYVDEEEAKKYYGEIEYIEDIFEIIQESANMENLYTTKSWSAEVLLYIASAFPGELNMTNWGYIPEEDEKGRNSIRQGRSKILVGFDVPKLNMPIRLHIETDRIKKIKKDINPLDITLPIYKGNTDFDINVNGRKSYFTTPLAVTIGKKQKNLLEKLVKEKDNQYPYYDLVQHLNWMSSRLKVPEKLKGEKEYIDLNNGKIVNKNLETHGNMDDGQGDK